MTTIRLYADTDDAPPHGREWLAHGFKMSSEGTHNFKRGCCYYLGTQNIGHHINRIPTICFPINMCVLFKRHIFGSKWLHRIPVHSVSSSIFVDQSNLIKHGWRNIWGFYPRKISIRTNTRFIRTGKASVESRRLVGIVRRSHILKRYFALPVRMPFPKVADNSPPIAWENNTAWGERDWGGVKQGFHGRTIEGAALLAASTSGMLVHRSCRTPVPNLSQTTRLGWLPQKLVA